MHCIRRFYNGYSILFAGCIALFVSCRQLNIQTPSLGDMAKVKRAERLYKRQEYEPAISLCISVINNGGKAAAVRRAKMQLARIYFETRQFEKTISLYDELLYKPADDILVADVTNYIDLLKRTGRVYKARQITEVYAKNYKNNARFANLQQSLVDYYAFFNRDSLEHVRVDSLRLSLPGYQYGLALYNEHIVFLSNDVKKGAAQSFYTNSKLYIIGEDGIEPFNSSLRGVLQVGPASFYENGKKVIFTSNRYTDIKNEKNNYISYNNSTQLLSSVYQPQNDTWSKPIPVKLARSGESYSFLHPSVAPNGKRLYFASDMPGGQGGTDIYYSDWDKSEKRWKTPVNMGPSVNTNGNELYPFIIGDRLFFASNGLQGFGGLDIFMIHLKKPEEATIHLPYPVNTQFDDLNPVLDESRRLLYFTSDRSGVHDNDHIYVLNLKKHPLQEVESPKSATEEEKVPYTTLPSMPDNRQQVIYVGDKQIQIPMEVKARDAYVKQAGEKPLPQPDYTKPGMPALKAAAQPVPNFTSDSISSSPEFVPWQPTGRENSNISVNVSKDSLHKAAAPVTTIISGNPVQLPWQSNDTRNSGQAAGGPVPGKDSAAVQMMVAYRSMPGIIYFDLNSYVPQDQEWRKLDSIFYLWKEHPERNVIVNGHSDVTGTERFNITLSRNRAVYIQECLRSRGVDADKIKINYYGSTRPVLAAEPSESQYDREQFIRLQGINRRCEVKLMTN